MKHLASPWSWALLLIFFSTPGAAADGLTTVKAADVRWQASPAVAKGVLTAVVQGDPDIGPSVALLKFPAGTRVPPHTHSSAETVVVVSGTVLMGAGEKADRKNAREIGTGGYFLIPAGTPHWLEARTEAVIARHSDGPRDIRFVDPKDDPRGKK